MEIKIKERLTVKNGEDLDKAFNHVDFIEINDEVEIFKDYSLWNPKTDAETKFKNAEELLSHSVGDKKVIDLLKDFSISLYE